MSPTPTNSDGPSPSTVAAAVAACPAVARLHAGPVGSYLPGDRIAGVSLDVHSARIVVDLAYPATVADLETQIRAALRPLLDVPVDIEVADIVLPGDDDRPAAGEAIAVPADSPRTPTIGQSTVLAAPPPVPLSTGDTA